MSWTEATTDAGRVYYFNSQTGESTWTRPEGVNIISMADASSGRKPSSSEPLPGANATAMAKISGSTSSTANIAGSWRELTAQNGRKYYINVVTKATVWEMPAEYREFLDRQQNKGAATIDRVNAEETFMRILREAGVRSDWEWEQALRLIIDHPSYKCIPSLQERKEVFAKYKQSERVRERDERSRLAQAAREAFQRMLDEDPRIQVGVRWTDAMEFLEDRPEYAAIGSSRERAEIFDAYISHLRRTLGNERKLAPSAGKFAEILQRIPEITLETTWKEGIKLFSVHPEFIESPELQRLDPMDMLIAYEKYIKSLEDKEVEELREARLEVRRKERLARKEMRRIIEELVESRKFTALTTWIEFRAMTGHLACFEGMITSHPSDPTPLDFYWDALDSLQRSYIPDRRIILDSLKESCGADSTKYPKDLRKFQDRIRSHPRFPEVHDLMNIELVFRELAIRPSPPLQKSANKLAEDDNSHGVDRKLIERYKHLIKHWKGPQPILIDSTYDQFRPLLQQHQEFQDISDEAVRRLYFDKFIHHLRRKAGLAPPPPQSVPTEPAISGPAPKRDGTESPEEGELVELADDYRPRRARSYY